MALSMNRMFRMRKKDLFVDGIAGAMNNPYMHIFTRRLRELIDEEG